MQKKPSSPGRPPKGAAAKTITLQVRVDAKVDKHVKASGGSPYVRELIVKSMKEETQPKKAAIRNGPSTTTVKTAMTGLAGKGTPPKVKKVDAGIGDYREAAIKEGAKPKPAQPTGKQAPAKSPTPKPTAAKSKGAAPKKK